MVSTIMTTRLEHLTAAAQAVVDADPRQRAKAIAQLAAVLKSQTTRGRKRKVNHDQILELAAAGKSSVEIARELGAPQSTVSNVIVRKAKRAGATSQE